VTLARVTQSQGLLAADRPVSRVLAGRGRIGGGGLDFLGIVTVR
jgi:hypothetical protein